MSNKHDEERELLQLECELARLKIAATHRKKLENRLHEKNQNHNSLLSAASSVSTPIWQLALLPKTLKYRSLMIAIIILTQFLGNKKR